MSFWGCDLLVALRFEPVFLGKRLFGNPVFPLFFKRSCRPCNIFPRVIVISPGKKTFFLGFRVFREREDKCNTLMVRVVKGREYRTGGPFPNNFRAWWPFLRPPPARALFGCSLEERRRLEAERGGGLLVTPTNLP